MIIIGVLPTLYCTYPCPSDTSSPGVYITVGVGTVDCVARLLSPQLIKKISVANVSVMNDLLIYDAFIFIVCSSFIKTSYKFIIL